MSTQLQLRRGTTAEHASFTGAVGETTVDTTKDSLVVHDGTTAGGIPIAKSSDITLGTLSVTADAAELNKLDGATASTAELNHVTGVTSSIQTQLGNINTDLLNDTTPQLGGDLDLNGNDITGMVLGTDVQAYDADTAKTDTAQSWTATQTLKGITETQVTKSSSFTPSFTEGSVYSCSGTMTITMPTATVGKSFTVIHSSATSITWSGTIKWNGGAAPTAGVLDIYVFVSDGTNWYGMQSGTSFA
jgi:hypothetical protein